MTTDDQIEMAWGVIANAHGGDWNLAAPEWREAAAKWRDSVMPDLHRRRARFLVTVECELGNADVKLLHDVAERLGWEWMGDGENPFAAPLADLMNRIARSVQDGAV